MTKALLTTKTSEITVLCISDVHLLHPRTPTEHIVRNIIKFVLAPSLLQQVDLFVIAGDLFDREGALRDGDVQRCILLMGTIVRACAEHDIVLRVLNGTPSHDRDQCVTFEALIKNMQVPLDYRYIDKIEIEHHQDLGIDVLYVPDEMHYDTAHTLVEVKKQLSVKRLEQVDLAFMHGIFDFQVPEITKPHIKHDSQAYLGVVKHFIFIGHDHSHQINGRIGVQGSFDRLSHSEEHKKGFLMAKIKGDKDQWIFVENKNALPFITITCYQDDLENALLYIREKVEGLKEGAHVRVLTKKSSPLFNALSVLKQGRPDIHWKVESKEKKQLVNIKPIENISGVKKAFIITPSSIDQLMRDRLKAKNAGQEVIEQACQKLKELIK